LDTHVQRAEVIKDLQRQGFNLFAIGSVLGAGTGTGTGTGRDASQADALAALLDRVATRQPALLTALKRHRIVARGTDGRLRVVRPGLIRATLSLRDLGVSLPAALCALVAVLDAVECSSGELLRVVQGEIVGSRKPGHVPGPGAHPMMRAQAVVTLLSEAQRVVLENAGSDLVRRALDQAIDRNG
ncbi:MAG: hypothetical protein ACRDNS_16170, partial [Trebonia sp.]